MDAHNDPERFLGEVRDTLLSALPLASEEDISVQADLNADKNIVVGEFVAPLIHGAGQACLLYTSDAADE